MREQRDQRDLAHVGGFAAHVRAGDQQHLARIVEQGVVRRELSTCASTTGCRPLLMLICGSSENCGALKFSVAARSANVASTSSSAIAAAMRCSCGMNGAS